MRILHRRDRRYLVGTWCSRMIVSRERWSVDRSRVRRVFSKGKVLVVSPDDEGATAVASVAAGGLGESNLFA